MPLEKEQFNKLLGQYIKKKRKDRGWSQTDLASAMGNNYQNISRLERGEVSPTLYWLHELATVFDLDLNQFVQEFYSKYSENENEA